jgi:predicted amidohydrolase YtcJ
MMKMKHTVKMMGPILSLTLIITMLATTIPVFAQDKNMVAFVNVNVIPMEGERILEDHTVVVEGDRITAMGPTNEVTVPDGAQVIEADGQYLIPGLTDNHAHPAGMPVALALYLANGVTTVRAFNGTPEDFEKRAAIESGEQPGPRLYIGPSVNGLSAFLVPPIDQLSHAVAPYFVIDLGPSTVTGCEDARRFVLTAHEMGADFIKTNLGLPLESFDCIVATANELGLPVKGHISSEVGTQHFINSGAEVQHATELYPFLSQEAIYDQPARHEDDLLLVDQNLPILIDMINANNMAFAPTLITPAWSIDQYEDLEGTLQRPEYRYYSPQVMQMLSNPEKNVFYVVAGIGFADEAYRDKIRAFGLEFTKALFDGGVMLLASSDAVMNEGGPVYGYSLHDELQLFVDAGLTPYQALETATRNSAIAMGELDEWGTIEVGKRADLVLLYADPLDDIANTEQIAGVMARGQWLTASDLQHMLDDIVASYEVIELVPFADEKLGISGLVPTGWSELEPGVYARGNPEVDPTLLLQLAAPGKSAEDFALTVLADFGVTELPGSMDSYGSAALTWELYQLESQMAPLALALGETDDAAYLVLLAAPGEELDALVETVFFPAVHALTPIE